MVFCIKNILSLKEHRDFSVDLFAQRIYNIHSLPELQTYILIT